MVIQKNVPFGKHPGHNTDFESMVERGPKTNLEHHVREKPTTSGIDCLFPNLTPNIMLEGNPCTVRNSLTY
jgi:hypothetical protein